MLKRYEKNLNSLTSDEIIDLGFKKVCIVGCGGLGGYVIEHLSRIGIGNLTAIDGDNFEESNLNRQILSTMDSLGKSKSNQAKIRINNINPNLNVKEHDVFLDSLNAINLLKDHDVAVDALDNIESKFVLQNACRELNIPFIYGSIAGWYGQISTIYPGDDSLNSIYKYGIKKGIEKKLGNLPFTASIVASLQSLEVIKLLLNKGKVMRNALLFVDCLNLELEEVKLK